MRALINSIGELSNSIRVFNWIREFSNWIGELFNSIRELSNLTYDLKI